MKDLDKLKMDTKVSVDSEISRITELESAMLTILQEAVSVGSGLLNSILQQSDANLVEVSDLQNEVEEWLQKIRQLSDCEQLRAQCETFIR
jgi:hypothetical protein